MRLLSVSHNSFGVSALNKALPAFSAPAQLAWMLADRPKGCPYRSNRCWRPSSRSRRHWPRSQQPKWRRDHPGLDGYDTLRRSMAFSLSFLPPPVRDLSAIQPPPPNEPDCACSGQLMCVDMLARYLVLRLVPAGSSAADSPPPHSPANSKAEPPVDLLAKVP